ncbi:MAG: ribose 5-phosphate isomerase B [Terriglobia bacterium]
MRVAIGADHWGYPLKQKLIVYLKDLGHQVRDLGTHSEEKVDYPDFADAVGSALQRGGADRGLLICGSGVGASVAANKLRGVRAGLCHDPYSARQGVQHDDMNVLVLGSRVIGDALAYELARAFLEAKFDPKERYLRRLDKVRALEARAAPEAKK